MSTQAKLFVAAVTAYALFASVPSWAEVCSEPAELSVEALHLTRVVERRRPMDPKTEFVADGERIFAFVALKNEGKRTRVRVVWLRAGKVYHRTRLEVGHAKRWRTWAYIRALRRLKGEWEIRVETLDGAELANRRFVIE